MNVIKGNWHVPRAPERHAPFSYFYDPRTGHGWFVDSHGDKHFYQFVPIQTVPGKGMIVVSGGTR